MKMFTFRFETVKLLAVFVGVCIIFGVLLVAGGFGSIGAEIVSAATVESTPNMEDNEVRLEFLKSFGWEVEENPVSGKTVTIPETFDAVYRKYNTDVQVPYGYDLTKFAGKKVTLYCYRILNYPTNDDVFANILVYDGEVIGGDVSSVALDGFMHGFSMPDGIIAPTNAQLND